MKAAAPWQPVPLTLPWVVQRTNAGNAGMVTWTIWLLHIFCKPIWMRMHNRDSQSLLALGA
jgi:hypothetical protein